MLRKLKLEIMIKNYISDIEEYCESAYEYLSNPESELDKEEIVMYLSSIPEIITYLEDTIGTLEKEYENEQLHQTT